MILAAARRRLCSPGEQARLAVVDQQEVPLLERFQQRRAEIVDPVIHGVAAGELDAVHLRAHAALQVGLDVAEEQIGLGAIALGQLRIEIGEDVEVGAQRLAVVHVGRVLAGPEEGLAGHALQPVEIDLARGQEIDIFLREIVAHHADDFHVREIRGGERDVRACAAEHAVYFSMGRFHAVISNGSNNDERHVREDCSSEQRRSLRRL